MSKKNTLSRKDTFRLANWLQNEEKAHALERPSFDELAKRASQIIHAEVTRHNMKTLHRDLDLSWRPRDSRSPASANQLQLALAAFIVEKVAPFLEIDVNEIDPIIRAAVEDSRTHVGD